MQPITPPATSQAIHEALEAWHEQDPSRIRKGDTTPWEARTTVGNTELWSPIPMRLTIAHVGHLTLLASADGHLPWLILTDELFPGDIGGAAAVCETEEPAPLFPVIGQSAIERLLDLVELETVGGV